MRTRKRLSIELSVNKFAPKLRFYFTYTFWKYPEYVSRVYSPPAADVNLLSITSSPKLDRSAFLKIKIIQYGKRMNPLNWFIIGLGISDPRIWKCSYLRRKMNPVWELQVFLSWLWPMPVNPLKGTLNSIKTF